ncbi:MAG TPA: VanZ family protein [Bacteroidales bacterium]|nr:VanZ family protein [Bacteroidales bacterium]
MIKRYKYTILLSLVILYLSLKNADELNKVQFLNIPHFDKFAHFCMYFALMIVAIFESRKSLIGNRPLLLLAIYPFLYGVLMEILQEILTTTRNASIYDVIFNTLGIFISVLVWMLIMRVYREKIR